jgi:hypothetical protein
LNVIEELGNLKQKNIHTISWPEFTNVAVQSFLKVIKSSEESSKKEEDRNLPVKVISENESRVEPNLKDEDVDSEVSRSSESKSSSLARSTSSLSSSTTSLSSSTTVTVLEPSEIQTCARILHLWGFLVRFEQTQVFICFFCLLSN